MMAIIGMQEVAILMSQVLQITIMIIMAWLTSTSS